MPDQTAPMSHPLSKAGKGLGSVSCTLRQFHRRASSLQLAAVRAKGAGTRPCPSLTKLCVSSKGSNRVTTGTISTESELLELC